MTSPSATQGERLVFLQMLRGVAALAVLLGHAQGAVLSAAAPIGTHPFVFARYPGGFGVDLFFAISGFIILASSANEAGRPGGRARFLRRRLVRLVPLYWLATLAFLPILLAGRVPPRGDLPTALLLSFLFIPHQAVVGPAGVFPVYDLGWTLDFEMFFYALFASCLAFSLPGACLGTAALLTGLVVAGTVLHVSGAVLSVWTAPILLEFVFGLGLGLLYRSRFRLPRAASVVLVLSGIVLVALDPFGLTAKQAGAVTPNDVVRVLGWGVPASLILCGAVFAEKGRAVPVRGVAAWLRSLGDASYSLYLVHPIVLIVLVKLWSEAVPASLRRELTTGPALGLALVLAAIATGLAVHRVVEVPLTRAVGRAFRSREPDERNRPVPAGGAA